MTKPPPTVGVLSPGDMGRSIGTILQAHNVRTLTCLAGRSERTRALAADAGFENTASLADLVQRVDILLCVLVPDQAAGVADDVATATVVSSRRPPLRATCDMKPTARAR